MSEYAGYTKATIITDENDSYLKKIAGVLAEETIKRSSIPLSLSPAPETLVISLEKDKSLPEEGFSVIIAKSNCRLIGGGNRGVLYAAGKLLRIMKWQSGRISLPLELFINETPKYPIRGMQLGYRPKTNAYDAWTPEIYEQYIRDMAFFGLNIIELMPPETDDALTNSLMKYDSLDMLCRVSNIAKSYGIDVSLWYPAMFKSFDDTDNYNRATALLERVFSSQVFASDIFVPGGDPGSLWPEELFMWAKQIYDTGKKNGTELKIWISPQTGHSSSEWTDRFYAQLAGDNEWLCGVIFAPWERERIDVMYEKTPKRYKIRHCPDISHSLRCQYPVAKWNITQALTLGREFVNPRPRAEKSIHNLYAPYMSGSICYSEGINDDVNKFVWLSQEWNPDTRVEDVLYEYSSAFISSEFAHEISRGLFMLEDNLIGELEENEAIEKTYKHWLSLEKNLELVNNYRLDLHLLRAVFDMYQKLRFTYETELERKAFSVLGAASADNIDKAIDNAKALMNKARLEKIEPLMCEKINALADKLFLSIGAQLTVSHHFASAWDRGAFVESLLIPLNDYRFIMKTLREADNTDTAEEKLHIVRELTNRQNPGEGGIYIDFGSRESYKHLENTDNYISDPSFYKTPLLSFLLQPPHDEDDSNNVPLSWQKNVSILYQEPLIINIDNLDSASSYTLRTVYARYHTVHISLYAGENDTPLHDEITVDKAFAEVTVPLPPEVYKNGKLRLKLKVRDGERGPNISELMIKRI